jgi:hypothetical protein
MIRITDTDKEFIIIPLFCILLYFLHPTFIFLTYGTTQSPQPVRKLPIYVLPLRQQTKFHIHIKDNQDFWYFL